MTTVQPTAHRAVEQAALQVVPPWVVIAVTDPRQPGPPLMAAELAATVGMAPKRKQEFAAGRYAARQALQALGHPDEPIRMGPDRAPIWPNGTAGSLSHCETVCIAIMTLRKALLGIDVEENADLDADLLDLVCSPNEQKWCDAEPSNKLRRARQIFAAKEAVYKAQYTKSKELLDFNDITISTNDDNCNYDAIFTRDVGPFPSGYRLAGKLQTTKSHILAAVTQPI